MGSFEGIRTGGVQTKEYTSLCQSIGKDRSMFSNSVTAATGIISSPSYGYGRQMVGMCTKQQNKGMYLSYVCLFAMFVPETLLD